MANGVIPEGFTIPCGGLGCIESENLFTLIYLVPATITPLVIVGTVVAMYRTVQKMLNSGVSALRLRASQQQKVVVVDPNAATRGRSNHSILFAFLNTSKSEFVSICLCVFDIIMHQGPTMQDPRSEQSFIWR